VEDRRTGTKVIGLLGVFGLLALNLASVSLYGIMACPVNQRRREIGIRVAWGAGQASVIRLILRSGNDTRHQRSCMRVDTLTSAWACPV
jgi:hypothetical protein